MLLRWGCGNVADVVTLKMLLWWSCWYLDIVVTLNMLLRWGCCYVEDVMLPTTIFKTGIVGVKGKTPHVHFAHGSLVDYNISMLLKKIINTQFHWCLRRQHKMTKMKNIKTFKRRTAYPRYVVRMLNWFHMLLSYRQKTKHCKTQWKMTFLYIFENCKQWTWLAFWGTSNLFPIYIIIYIYYIFIYAHDGEYWSILKTWLVDQPIIPKSWQGPPVSQGFYRMTLNFGFPKGRGETSDLVLKNDGLGCTILNRNGKT